MVDVSHITRILPPPRMMTLPSVGVDISGSSLKYIQFHGKGAELAVAHWGAVALPSGVITHGSVADVAALVEILKHVSAICGTPYVRVSLPEERAYLFETTIPRGTAEEDIRNLLEFRMEENVPLSPKDVFFDYDIVADDTDSQLVRVGVTVYTKETVLNYYDAFEHARVLPLSFEVEVDAIARAVISPDENGVCLLLDLGTLRTGLGIVSQRVLLYTSTITIGGQHFSDALRAVVGNEEETVLMKLKNERGLLHSGEPDDVYEALLPVVAALKDEVATGIAYWNTRNSESGGRTIKKILLSGGSSNMAGLPEYLTEVLGIETERVDVWRNVFTEHNVVPPITLRYSYGYATAVGLALRDVLQ